MTNLPDSSLVTIVLPVRNSARTLDLAIRSVLAQTYPKWELLIIDDGSSDESPAIAKRFDDRRIQLLCDGLHRGLAARLNQGIDLARGKYLARMDGDDICFPQRLQRQLAYLQVHPEVDLVGSRAIVFADNGEPIGNLPFCESHETICRAPWRNFDLPHPTWLGRIEWFRRFHYGIPEAVRCEDQELLLRAYRSSRYACLPDLLLGYRRTAFSLKKAFPTRFHLAFMHMKTHIGNRRYGYALLAVGFHVAKAGLDILRALLPGTRLKASRFLAPARQADIAQWTALWESFNPRDSSRQAGLS